MTKQMLANTPSGISCCGDLHWGAHFCHLYETRDDLIDTLVPFFAAGLMNNEQCLWVTSKPLSARDATAALAERVPDLQAYLDRGQIRIVDHDQWYAHGDAMDKDSLLQAWVDAEQQALAKGFKGLRATGNLTFTMSREAWGEFQEYEACVTETFAGRRILGLCSYQLDTANGSEILDAVRNHQFAVARRGGEWEMVESAAIRHVKREAHRTNLELEEHVAQRTAELRQVLATVKAQKHELETALRMRDDTQRQLEAELADARLLQSISAALIDGDGVTELYQELLEAAALLMRSDFASMQRYHPERGKLELLAHRGFSPEAAAFWAWVHADSTSTCALALRRHERVIARDVETFEFVAGTEDLVLYRANGIRSVQTTPLLTRGGTLIGMISTLWKQPHEPSERDLRLLDIVARQAADLIERTAAMEAMRDQTRQLLDADRRKDEFLATLAHELRNPLAPIRTGLDVLKIGKPEHAPRVLKMMERQLAHMVRLVDDLLDVSRVSRGIVALKRERVELNAVIESAIETSRPLLEAARHELVLTLAQQPVWLDVDTTRVAQVLSNVLNNAAKYTPHGGRIGLSVECVGSEVLVRVTDTGIGIPAAMLPKVFELFTQVDQAIERSQGGLGVGLSLARQLVEMHDGSITAESDGPGQGATFTIRLPLAEAVHAALATGQACTGENAEGGMRVLVVDDNTDAAETLALLLNASGHSTRVVCDASQALESALDFRPDVAFLDLGMPYLSGFDLACQLRAQPVLDGVALIALSGWGSDDDRARSRDAGFDHHITKPVLPGAVQDMLARVTRDARAGDTLRA